MFSLFSNKRGLAITASVIWACCFALGVINLWPYFWRRSLPTQLLLLALLMAAAAGLFFLALKRVSPSFIHMTRRENLRLTFITFIVSMLLMIVLFPFTALSRNLPVPHTLTISAVNEKNPASGSSDVKLLEIKIDGKTVAFNSLENRAGWSNEEGALRSHGQAMLSYSFTTSWDTEIELVFEESPSGGFAQIEYDDQAPIESDLFSTETGTKFLLIPSSLFSNKTSLVFATLLFIIEYIAIFWLIYILPIYSHNPYAGLFIVCGLILASYQFEVNFGFDKVNGGWQYFRGSEGAITAYGPVITYGRGTGDRADVFHCLEILEKVPGSAKVLNLNGFGAVEPCLFSPLLPQDKIVHHYEAVAITEPYYQTLMFGEPQAAYQVYRDLGINYFYIRKGDLLFVNLGYSHALEPEYIEQYFDIFAEAPDFYILTWRGEGQYPVPPEISQEISIWYEHGKQERFNPLNFWWAGRVGLEDWVQIQP